MLRTLLGTDLWIDQKSSQAFNLDTVLLAHFIKVPAKSKIVLDLGTGAGALMLYLSTKTKAKIIGVEVQEDRYLQALKNVELNHLQNQLFCLNQDIKTLKMKNVDCIVSNPPFFKVTETSNINDNDDETIARHEVLINLEELVSTVSKTLKFAGHFFMIHRPNRFAELVSIMQKYQLEIKRVRFVHPYIDHKANHVLIHAIKNGQPESIIEAPLVLYKEKHIFTDEMNKINGGK